MKDKKVCLLILDGLGEGEKNISNPIRFSKMPNLDYLRKNYPFYLLAASGIAVGLPSNEPGNCEIGHLTIGIGAVYFQNNTKINLSIESGEFFKNETLLKIFKHCHNFNSRLHLIGLLSEDISKTDKQHLYALLDLAKMQKVQNVYLHLFTDGIDSPPKSALGLLQELQARIKDKNYPAKIATLCGRFYALDETGNYLFNTQKVFLLITEGKGIQVSDWVSFLKEKYQDAKFNDSFLEPLLVDKEGIVKDNDAILFFHFENKSIFQLANAFLNPNFKEFKRPPRKNLYIASLTKYLDLDYPFAFEEQKILTNLSRILAENKLTQLKLVEASKENILRYYFNGFVTEEHPNEIFKILPAFKTDKDKLLEHSKDFMDALALAIKDGGFNFIVANLPTLDLVGHIGDFRLAIDIIEKIDALIAELYNVALKNKFILIITSDHGNVEKMLDLKTGKIDTSHNLNPVPFYLIDESRKREKTKQELSFYEKKILGSLADIAPTILEIFGIPQPREFGGKSLLKYT